MITNKLKKISQNNQLKVVKSIGILLLLYTFTNCSNEDSPKTKNKTDNFMNTYLSVVAARAVVYTHFPYPYQTSCNFDDRKVCVNFFSHSDTSCGEGYIANSGKCPTQDSVGACVFHTSYSVAEHVYYSQEMTPERAKQKCQELSDHPMNQNITIRFQEVYNPSNTSYPKNP